MKNIFAWCALGALVAVACGDSTNGAPSTSSSSDAVAEAGASDAAATPAVTSDGGSGGGNHVDVLIAPENPAGAAACEAAGNAICQRACACSTDGKCHLAVITDAGVPSAINFDDMKACTDVYVTFGCFGGGEPGVDYATCEARMKTSVCLPSAGGQAAPLSADCRP